MRDRKNILFCSIAFPPKKDPECLQTAKHFKYLVKGTNKDYDVVTSALPTLFMPEDTNLESYAVGVRQLIDVSFFENKYVNFLKRKLDKDSLSKPDSKYGFARKWGRVTSELKAKPHLIYSRSFPMSSTYMAYELACYYQVPWVLHMSDPWVGSPIHQMSVSLEKELLEVERKFFTKADIVCLTSKKTIDFYVDRYPEMKDKFRFSPNVYDQDDIVNESYAKKEKLRMVYTGGLSGNRTPLSILKALEVLEDKKSPVLKDLEICFAGQFDRSNQELIDKSKSSCIKDLGEVSYAEALELQRSSDVNLVIDTPLKSPKEALFFPSKLLDYFIARKRILAITDLQSTTHEIVEGVYGTCYEHGDVIGLVAEVEKIHLEWEKGNSSYFYNEEIDSFYSAHFNAEKLNDLFDKLIDQRE